MDNDKLQEQISILATKMGKFLVQRNFLVHVMEIENSDTQRNVLSRRFAEMDESAEKLNFEVEAKFRGG